MRAVKTCMGNNLIIKQSLNIIVFLVPREPSVDLIFYIITWSLITGSNRLPVDRFDYDTVEE